MDTALVFADLLDNLLWLITPSNWWVILQVVLGLGFVVFVHELGHFVVAKLCGVKCEKFYLGFDIGGLKLFKYQYGETEYGIGILPLGGYVKMLGQDDNPYRAAEESKRAQIQTENRPSGDLPPEPTSEPHPPYDPRSYMAQSVPERMAIISAGVIMNVIFAFLMAMVAYQLGVKEMPCRISHVFPAGAAWTAGMKPGDEVVRIGNLEKPKYEDLRTRVPLSDVEEGIEFVIRRPGQEELLTLRLYPQNQVGVPLIGVGGAQTLDLKAVSRYSAAARAEPKLQRGDRVVAVNGVSVESFTQFNAEALKHQSEPLTLTVERRVPEAEGSEPARPEDGPAPSERLEVKIPPAPRKHFGMVMRMGSVIAIQSGSPADGKLQVDDQLLRIDREDVGDPMTLDDRLSKRAGETVSVTVKRGTSQKSIEIALRHVEWHEEPGIVNGAISAPALGIAYLVYPDIEAVHPGGPADKAGIKSGDRIVSVMHTPPKNVQDDKDKSKTQEPKLSEALVFKEKGETDWPLLMDFLQTANPDGTFEFKVASGDESSTVALQPITSEALFNADRGLIFELEYDLRVAEDLGEAARLGYRKTEDSLLMVYRFLQRLSEGDISPRMLGGPVTIATVAGQAAQEGLPSLLIFLTMLSANLAVVNFLPIPVLDGGHMVFLIWEGITGKPPNERVFVLLSYLGLAFILTLMLFVLGLDFGFISRR